MPKVTQQGRVEYPKEWDGESLLAKAVPVNKLKRTPLKVLLYGPNRVGKTTFACQGPKPTLLVSFEPTESGGAESVRLVEGVNYLHPANTTDAVKIALELRHRAMAGYKMVIVDSTTSLQDMVLRELLNLPTLPDMNSWGTVQGDTYRERSEKTREVLRYFVDLQIDTIFLAKEKDHNPPREERTTASGKSSPDMRPKFVRGTHTESYIAADMGGATTQWLQDTCDCICRLFVEEEIKTEVMEAGGQRHEIHTPTGKYIRYLRMGYHPNYAAGVRSCTPQTVPEVIPNPTFDKMVKALRGV